MEKEAIVEALEGIKGQVEAKFENVAKAEDLEAKADKAEIETKADKAEVETLKEELEAIVAKFDSIPAIINNNKEEKMEFKSVNEAFEAAYAEKGSYSADVELKAITQTSPITGAPKPTLGLTGDLYAANPVRALARNLAVTSSSVVLPRKTGNHGAAVANATNKGTKASGSAAVGEVTILAKTINAQSEVTVEAAADIVGFDQFWAQDMLNELAVKEAEEHVSAVEALTSGVTASAAADLALDDFGSLIFDVAPQYRVNGVLMVSTGAMQKLRELNQSGTGSDLVFDPQAGTFRLFGYEVRENGYMAAVAASNVVAAFGNWNQGLTLVNRESATVGRFLETKPGHITYYAQMRSGIGEVNTAALSKLTMAAA